MDKTQGIKDIIDTIVKELLTKNGGGMRPDQYLYLATEIAERSPCNVLIFSVGFDTKLWCFANDGKTVFLENSVGWAKIAREQNPKAQVDIVSYSNGWKTVNGITEEVENTEWDIIIVDGPGGGRMGSISEARRLASGTGKTDVYFHDAQRERHNINEWFDGLEREPLKAALVHIKT